MIDERDSIKSKDQWSERAKVWSTTSPIGMSTDDTFNQMIIAETGIKSGERVLDLASGTGNPAISIAYSMGEQGAVICTDRTLQMLIAAQTRGQNLNLNIIEFVGADMASLPFENNVFDAVTCRFGITFLKNKVTAALESHRVLKTNGRAAFIVWGDYEENPPFYIPQRAVAQYLGISEGPTPSRHAMSAPGALKEIMAKAGFLDVEERELRYKNRVDDVEDYVTRNLKRSFAKETENMPPIEFARLKDKVISAWQPFFENNILQVPNYARLALGSKSD